MRIQNVNIRKIKMKRFVLMFIFLSFFAIGCAHNVNVSLQPIHENMPSSDNQLQKLGDKIVFSQGNFIDSRPDPSKLLVIKGGGHTFNYYENPRVEVVLYDELKNLVTSSGHQWDNVERSDVKIDITFIACNAESKTGWVFVGATSYLQFKLDFIDTKRNQMLYSNTYSNNGMYRQPMAGIPKRMVTNAVSSSISKCIDEVGEDRKLAEALAQMELQK